MKFTINGVATSKFHDANTGRIRSRLRLTIEHQCDNPVLDFHLLSCMLGQVIELQIPHHHDGANRAHEAHDDRHPEMK